MPRIQVRRYTSTQFTNDNPTLYQGEMAYETDTKKMKIGDGVTAWNSLPYGTDASKEAAGTSATHAAVTATHGATGAIVGTTNTQTLTNKTLTSPIISTISNTGTLTLPTSTDTLVARATTDTLTNKTLTTPVINGFTGDTTAINIGSGQLVKDASGNVGIAKSPDSSGYKLQVNSGLLLESSCVAGASNNRIGFAYNGTATPSSDIRAAIDLGVDSNGYGYLQLMTGGVGATIPTEKVRIDKDGNVGIGVSPSEKLTVSGNELVKSGNKIYLASSTNTHTVGITSPAADTFAIINNAGSETVRVDSSGKVGIGITPTQKLTVNAASNVNLGVTTGNTATNIRILGLNDAANSIIPIEIQGAGIKLLYNATDGVIMDNSGNVGIGGTATAYKLELFSADTVGGNALRIRANSTAGKGGLQFTDSGATTQYGYVKGSSSGLSLSGTGSDDVRIDSSGNVGVGGTPQVTSAGRGNVTINGSSESILAFGQGGSNKDYIYCSDKLYIQAGTSRALVFNANATEAARIDSSGNLLVGQTTPQDSTHTIYKATGTTVVVYNGQTRGTGYYLAKFGNATDIDCQIRGDGNLENRNNAYGAISDQKLKTNITDARSYLDDLCNVKIRKYNFKDEPDAPQQIGVIAQELETVFAGMVEESQDTAQRPTGKYEQKEITPAVIDEETGEVVTAAVMGDDLDKPIMETYLTGETTKSVKYSVFVPMLITAVQDLKAKNDTQAMLIASQTTHLSVLEAKYTALEAQNTALEARLALLEAAILK